MPEEMKETEKTAVLTELSPQKARQAFLVPNLIHLAAVMMVLVAVVTLCFVPMMQVSMDKTQVRFSTMDMITDMKLEASCHASALEPAGNGNFSQAVSLLAMRVSDQGWTTGLQNHLDLIMVSFLWFGIAAVIAAVILTVMFVILLVQAIIRFFASEPSVKLGEGYVVLLAPLLLLVVPKLAGWILGVLKMGGPITCVGLHPSALLLLLVVGAAALILDILCYVLTRRTAKKFQKMQKSS